MRGRHISLARDTEDPLVEAARADDPVSGALVYLGVGPEEYVWSTSVLDTAPQS